MMFDPGHKISVLLIEDDEDDYFLTTDLLESVAGRNYDVTWSSEIPDGTAQLRSGVHDVCLVDNRLGPSTGVELLAESGEALRKTPAILLTGEHSNEVDEAAMRAGASDYLVKGELTADVLDRTIRYALQRREADARIEYLAFHDPLTDLPNRLLFHDRVAQALARRQRTAGEVFVVFFDIDNFKDINDTRGHAAGDVLLSQVASRIRNILRDVDTLARLGGDEFAICVEGGRDDDLPTQFIRRIRESLREPFVIDGGTTVDAAASFGVASTCDTSPVPEELLRNADIAMYESKRAGKDTWSYYEKSMHEQLQQRIALEKDLAEAIRSGGLELHFQPFVSLEDGQVLGFEALSRWDHPTRGPQSPGEFIALAEETGLIVPLGELVLMESARAAKEWSDEHGFEGFVSVNVSPKQITDSGFIDSLNHVLEYTGLPPARLVIEFTESIMTSDVEVVVSILEKAAEIGVGIALDDFGTGYSSLSNVHLLPITVLKVDRSFVQRHDDRKGRSMLRTISTMADSLGLIAIAEGIENLGQRDSLVELGYGVGQGFAYSKAVADPAGSGLFAGTIPIRNYSDGGETS